MSVLRESFGWQVNIGRTFGDIVGLAVDDHPAALSTVVLCDLLAGELLARRLLGPGVVHLHFFYPPLKQSLNVQTSTGDQDVALNFRSSCSIFLSLRNVGASPDMSQEIKKRCERDEKET